MNPHNLPLAALLLTACATAGKSPDPYADLLKNERITSAVVWEAETGPLAYSDWSQAQRDDLARALDAVEAGKPAGLTAPPAPIIQLKIEDKALKGTILEPKKSADQCEDDGHVFYSASDAWTLYLAHVAHSLWLERHHKVAWSLTDMSDSERAILLDSRLLQKRKDESRFEATRFVMGHALSWDPAVAYRFLKENKFLGSDPETTVIAVTGWASHNLRHILASEKFADLYGYPGPIPIDRLLYPAIPGPRKVGGCWGVTGFYSGVLRGANIPVEASINGQHSRPFFPTAGRFLNHGDDIYGSWVAPVGNEVPPGKLLLTREEWRILVESPALDCTDGKCNTREEQADYNVSRRQRLLARDYLTDGPMYDYAAEGPDYLDDSLRGYRVNNGLHTYVKPFLSEEERAAFIAEVEAELKRLGGGDIKKGGEVVLRRSRAFWR